jgi:lipoate-protein ligase A
MPFRLRIVVDHPSEAAWNMAVDEALLGHVAAGDDAVWLRFYQWAEPTLSLGYFQPLAAWRDHVTEPCAVVRRQTGGGAILHDRELTYSVVLPPGHPAALSVEVLYTLVHESLIATLADLGISARLFGMTASPPEGTSKAFLCFERRSPYDVILPEGHKILGSAQRRRHGAVLMHGSLILASSRRAPQILGIAEVTQKHLTAAEILSPWTGRLADALDGSALDQSTLPETVQQSAQTHVREKYAHPAWTGKR